MADKDITAEGQARRLEQVFAQLEATLQRPLSIERLRASGSDNEWSTIQILGHMAEMIPYWLHCCHGIMIATGEYPRFGRAEDAAERLEGVESGASKTLEEMMRLLKQEIATAATAIRAMSAADREKIGLHVRRGEMTVATILEGFVVAHAEAHFEQICQTLE